MARRFSFVLPADWWRIPLVSEEARTTNIDHMVDHQFPNKDEAAQLRHDLKEELNKQASQAAQIGGLVMAFCLLNLEGAPVSATMTCYDVSGLISLPEELNPAKILAHYVGDKELDESLPDLAQTLYPDGLPEASDEPVRDIDGNEIPGPETAPESEPTVIEELADTVQPDEGSEEEAVEVHWDKVTDFDILAYRNDSVSEGTDYFGEESLKIPQLHVTYMQVVPDFGLVQTVFTTPLIDARDEWIQMWDAMVATYRNGSPEESENTPEEA